MNEIKVNVVFTDGYQKRYTEAVAKAYQKKKHLQINYYIQSFLIFYSHLIITKYNTFFLIVIYSNIL